MLDSKDYVIKMFKEEIERKNQLIRELLERQEYLETRLTKIEAVLLFDEEDLEAQTGIKREDDVDIEEEVIHKKDEATTKASGSSENDSTLRQKEDEDKLQTLMQTEVEKFEQDLLTVDEEWRDLYKESMTFTDILKQEIFEPNQPWNKWQETKNYKIEVSTHISFIFSFIRRESLTLVSLFATLIAKFIPLLTIFTRRCQITTQGTSGIPTLNLEESSGCLVLTSHFTISRRKKSQWLVRETNMSVFPGKRYPRTSVLLAREL